MRQLNYVKAGTKLTRLPGCRESRPIFV